MSLNYQSTRDKKNQVTASQAILQGLAIDGGLYVPSELPVMNLDFKKLAKMSYQEVAYLVMKEFLTDFTESELTDCIKSAYDHKFADEKIAPLRKVGKDYYLELFHGSTIAFKDMALSILPYLMTTAAKKNQVDQEIVILTATSGDTGKAAMAGFADVPGTKIIVFYPKNGVSPIQEKQMVTQAGKNTWVVGITGNFDDAQTNVKEMFNNQELKKVMANNGKQFSSANSINIGRLVPQIVYYVYAYAQLVASGEITVGDEINVSVPTGNFGNILAAYYAQQIGVPINKLVCASNENNVLTDFLRSGTYNRNREFMVTSSPSMDILVSSNLERLLFHVANNDDKQTKALMDSLLAVGKYSITQEMSEGLVDFYGDFATEEEATAELKQVFKQEEYTLDPHTAVAAAVYDQYREATGDKHPTVIVSTASPYKFPRAVVKALTGEVAESTDDFELVTQLAAISELEIPAAVSELVTAKVRHDIVVESKYMQETVESILKLS